MTRLVLGLLRPYRGWLAIVFVAMLAEIAASLAAPWPLKLVLDDALGKHHLPHWLEWAHDYGFGRHTLGVALFAGALIWLYPVLIEIVPEGQPTPPEPTSTQVCLSVGGLVPAVVSSKSLLAPAMAPVVAGSIVAASVTQ